MKVYKVVDKVDGKLVSSTTHDQAFCTEYKKTGWTYPKFKGTRLFVFDTLKNAINWTATGEEVWECEAPKTYKCVYAYGMLKYWLAKLGHKRTSDLATRCQITGSLMVDKVKLLRKVY